MAGHIPLEDVIGVRSSALQKLIWPHLSVVRNLDFHSSNSGSNPLGAMYL